MVEIPKENRFTLKGGEAMSKWLFLLQLALILAAAEVTARWVLLKFVIDLLMM